MVINLWIPLKITVQCPIPPWGLSKIVSYCLNIFLQYCSKFLIWISTIPYLQFRIWRINLTTSMICCRVRPNERTTASDSLMTGLSSLLYPLLSSRSVNNLRSCIPLSAPKLKDILLYKVVGFFCLKPKFLEFLV